MIVYSTGCPKCEVLLSKLNNKKIKYELCTDIQKMKEKGIDNVPVLEVKNKYGDSILYPFSTAVKYINDFKME